MAATRPVRLVTYNIRACLGRDGRRDPERIGQVLRDLSPDVVGLQEVDVGWSRSGAVDQARAIAGSAGLEHRRFHPSLGDPDRGYGNALLSRWPLHVRRAAPLPFDPRAPGAETRSALWARVDAPLGAIEVVNTHLGRTARERRLQVRALLGDEWLGNAGDGSRCVLLGDLNLSLWTGAYRLLRSRLRDALGGPLSATRRTFPAGFPLLRIDHVLIAGPWRAVASGIDRSRRARVASDHLPAWADLRRGNP